MSRTFRTALPAVLMLSSQCRRTVFCLRTARETAESVADSWQRPSVRSIDLDLNCLISTKQLTYDDLLREPSPGVK